jgi:MDMPI C-terminal domain
MGDAAVRGTAADLHLWLWGRVPLDNLEVFGDPRHRRAPDEAQSDLEHCDVSTCRPACADWACRLHARSNQSARTSGKPNVATSAGSWHAGRVKGIHMLDTYVLGAPGDSQMTATTANGQPAAAVYHRDADNTLQAHGIVVLAPTATGVSRVIEFHDPALVATFGFPDVLAD